MGSDLHDGAPLAGLVEFLHGLAGTFEGVGATALGSGDEVVVVVVAVITAQRMTLSRKVFCCPLRRTACPFDPKEGAATPGRGTRRHRTTRGAAAYGEAGNQDQLVISAAVRGELGRP
nr:hypothetical protein [Mycobacterium sp.]